MYVYYKGMPLLCNIHSLSLLLHNSQLLETLLERTGVSPFLCASQFQHLFKHASPTSVLAGARCSYSGICKQHPMLISTPMLQYSLRQDIPTFVLCPMTVFVLWLSTLREKTFSPLSPLTFPKMSKYMYINGLVVLLQHRHAFGNMWSCNWNHAK